MPVCRSGVMFCGIDGFRTGRPKLPSAGVQAVAACRLRVAAAAAGCGKHIAPAREEVGRTRGPCGWRQPAPGRIPRREPGGGTIRKRRRFVASLAYYPPATEEVPAWPFYSMARNWWEDSIGGRFRGSGFRFFRHEGWGQPLTPRPGNVRNSGRSDDGGSHGSSGTFSGAAGIRALAEAAKALSGPPGLRGLPGGHRPAGCGAGGRIHGAPLTSGTKRRKSFISGRGSGGAAESPLDSRIRVGETSSAAWRLRGKPVACFGLPGEMRGPASAPSHPSDHRSFPGVPVAFGDRLLGVLSLFTPIPRAHTVEEIDLLAGYADQAGHRPGDAQLHAEALRREAEVRALLRAVQSPDGRDDLRRSSTASSGRRRRSPAARTSR